MTSPERTIPRAWIASAPRVLWGAEGTYTSIAYDRLPALPPVDSTFLWLENMPDRDYSSTLNSDDNRLGSMTALEVELASLGYHFPEDFAVFIRHPGIFGRIPTCTDCFLSLSDTVVPLPGFPGSYVVRFMSDSQSCILWYLLFQPSRSVRVLASPCFIEKDIFDEMEYAMNYEDVTRDSCICAESFGEFMCRFSLENMIWFATRDDRPLSPLEQQYLDQAHRARP